MIDFSEIKTNENSQLFFRGRIIEIDNCQLTDELNSYFC